MSVRAEKKRKNTSNREETTSSSNRDGLLFRYSDVPRITRVDTKRECNSPNLQPLRRGRDKSRTRESRTRDEAPYRKRRCVDAGEGQALNSPPEMQVGPRVFKRKREHLEGKRSSTEGEGTSRTCMTAAKRTKPDTNFYQLEGESSSRSAAPSSSVPDPPSVESFIYHKVLGKGRFGKVLLASEKVTGHRLAVKITKKRQLIKEGRTRVANLEKHALQIAQRSPFLCSSYATFQSPDHLFYVMDYMAGGDLHHLIKNKAPFDVETTRIYTAELASGLQALHSRGIIHRDLKPLNIFIDSDRHARIGDFGLSKIKFHKHQKVSGCAGSPRYMAPEVLQGKEYDEMVDWFSLGVIVYFMSTGKYPFYNGTDIDRLKRSILEDNPIYPEDLNTDVKDLINNLLCKSPKKRRLFVKQRLRTHPMFRTIDWMALKSGELSPPIQVEPTPDQDVIPVVTMLKARKSQRPQLTSEEQQHFMDFSSVSRRWRHLQPENLWRTTPSSTNSSVQGALIDIDLFSSTSSSSESSSSMICPDRQ
ncbi:protein kinase C delta type-like isoform 1-T1 [Anomaloglossus baeobatrachus]|uniref:protein kinase C delta type-like n=1 Tax=Anomaloglossus baeobatrachus TaxID=238106 RepID=UPI003F50B7C0